MIQKQAGTWSSIWNATKMTGKGLAYTVPGYSRASAISKAFKRINPDEWFPGIKRFFNSDKAIMEELSNITQYKLAKFIDELDNIKRQIDSGVVSPDLLARRDAIIKEMETIIGGPVDRKIAPIHSVKFETPQVPNAPQQHATQISTMADKLNRTTKKFEEAINQANSGKSVPVPMLPTYKDLDILVPGSQFKGVRQDYATRYRQLQEARDKLLARRSGHDVLQEFSNVKSDKLNLSKLEAGRLPGRFRSGIVNPMLAGGAAIGTDYLTGGKISDKIGDITGLHPIKSLKETLTSPILDAANKLRKAKQLQQHMLYAGGGAVAGGLMGGDIQSAAVGGLAGGTASYLGSDEVKPYKDIEEALKDYGLKDMV